MKTRSRIACISAAVAALVSGGSLQARDLDFNEATLMDDGLGGKFSVWDTSSANWLEAGAGATWVNAPADSAIFGNTTNAFVGATKTNNLILTEPITVQDITLGIAANGGTYNVVSFALDFPGSTLTLNGNVTKAAGAGNPQLALENGLILSAGDHTFATNDTGGDAAPELTVNAPISGAGNVVVNNGPTFATWGTTAFTNFNSYTGTTSISKGRLIITKSSGLGSAAAGTTISNLGTLSVGGAGTAVQGGVDLAEPITITRSTYSGGDFGQYPAAIVFANSGTARMHTITGPIVIDSTDARISVNSNTLVLPGGNISLGANGAAGVLSFTGDYGGFVQLQGSNPALAANGIRLVNAVEVQVTSHDNLGGPTAPITFSGDATLGIMNGFMTDFGAHVVNYDSFSGGLHIPAGNTFNLTQPITGGNGMGKRGAGTLNFNAAVNATGSDGGIFWDAGVVNINANHTVGAIHLRSPVVNIADGVVVTTTRGYSSLGQDNGDSATVNILGTAQYLSNTGTDFNVSDNAGSSGVINIPGNGTLSVNGKFFISKNNNTHGTVNQDGGTVSAKRGGGESFVIGQGGGSDGKYIKTGGTLAVTGQMWISNNGGSGVLTQSGGAVTINDWVAIGRNGGTGTFNLSGGTVTKTGGGNFLIAGGGGTNGTLNQTGGTITVSSGQTWMNEGASTAVWNFSAGTANLGRLDVGRNGNGGGTATLNMSGTASLNATIVRFGEAQNVQGTINLNGGVLTATQVVAGASSGTKTFNFNGGTLRAGADSATFMQGLTAANVKDGGVNVDTNGRTITVGQALLADGTGGLTKTGTGTLTLSGANTYSGATTVNGGSVVLAVAAWNPVMTGGGAVINAGSLVFDYAGTTSPLATVAPLLKASHDSSTFTDPTQRFRTTNAVDANRGLGYADDGASRLTVAYTWYGDANADGTVNADDYALADRGRVRGLAHWFNGDFNYDGVVDSADYMRLDTSFGILNPGALTPSFLAAREAEFGSQYVSQLVAAVPEPAGVGILLGIGAAGSLGRRRNRR